MGLLGIYLIVLFSPTGLKPLERWVVVKESRLQIKGSTNLGEFECHLEGISERDTVEFTPSIHDQQMILGKGEVRIPVNDFLCENKVMTKDFKETLRYEEHPYIYLQFVNLKMAGEDIWIHESLKGQVRLTIVGVSKLFDIEFKPRAFNRGESDQGLRLLGKVKTSFSEFDLEAPERLLGLMKVADSIESIFELTLLPVAESGP